ncbi:DUF1643 domain-containing protein [Paenibacillus sp. HN-1]|uniref:DUF1643 domain-containing protein n=1 Tax=Paenibacillus TaxID=44249 RepID=UPI000FC32B7C|nr:MULTISPECIES: DUF1643 domain-containing protein [Paenibacillus]MBY9079534.1 DUF1643 domain-containing protein [Paenibacillus sp. CGMCC 1.18879]MBY9083355.1 DUF1643 domain-containing protein [Paenibacillus sinensis]
MNKGAIIDETGSYRYLLWRTWDENLPKVLFIMLNPSTADENEDDPTICRCIGFAKKWGYGSLEVVNLFAYRATDPDELKVCNDPVGPENDVHIIEAIKRTGLVVAAWGVKGRLNRRDKSIMKLLSPVSLNCLAVTKEGHPRHPLYVKSDRNLVRYVGR